MNLVIANGQEKFYQWDTGRYLQVIDDGTCKEVHYALPGTEASISCEILDHAGIRLARVPDILLQESGMLFAYLFFRGEDGTQTRYSRSFQILIRPKPADYTYTEEEFRTWDALDQRLSILEDDATYLALLIQEDMLPAVYDADGRILTDAYGNVILRY